MVDTTNYLQVGMTKKQVLREAKQIGLDNESRQQIKLFFRNDEDKIITNDNELAILNKFFEKSALVVMPKNNTKDGCSTYKSEKGKKKTYDTLIDYNNDGYADARNIQTDKKRKDGVIEIEVKVDRNLDGAPDKGQGFHAIGILSEAEPTTMEKFENAIGYNTRMYAHGKLGFSDIRTNSTAPSNQPLFGGGLGIEYRNKKNHVHFEGTAGTTVQAKFEYGHNFNLGQINNDLDLGIEPYAAVSATNRKDYEQNQFFGSGALINLKKKTSSGNMRIGLGIEAGKNFSQWSTGEVNKPDYHTYSNNETYVSPRLTFNWDGDTKLTKHLGFSADFSKREITGTVRFYFNPKK